MNIYYYVDYRSPKGERKKNGPQGDTKKRGLLKEREEIILRLRTRDVN